MITVMGFKAAENFKSTHKHITYEFIDGKIMLKGDNGDMIVTTIPYANGFCMHPVKCAGHGSCPRNRACSE